MAFVLFSSNMNIFQHSPHILCGLQIRMLIADNYIKEAVETAVRVAMELLEH